MTIAADTQVWERLGALAHEARGARGYDLRATAELAGCDFTRISRFGRHGDRLLPANLRRVFVTIRPRLVSRGTVVWWHRQGWRLFWRWKSRTRPGRPHLPAEVRNLIATLSRENVPWGTERIRGELLKLGTAVSDW